MPKNCIGPKNRVNRLKSTVETIKTDIRNCQLIVDTSPQNTQAKQKLIALKELYKKTSIELENAEIELANCEASYNSK